MTETDNKPSITSVIVLLLAVPLGVFLNAYVLAHLWFWFIVPLGVPAIGLAHAFGLGTLKGFLIHGLALDKQDETKTASEKVWATTSKLVITPLVILLMGYIFYSFM